MAKPIPDGFHTITPHLAVTGAAKAIDFYKKAFGAEELGRHPTPDGRLMHAMIKIGDSFVMMADCFPEMGGPCRSPQDLGGTGVTLNLYTTDCDKVFNQAVAAGAKVLMPLMDMFWGDRYGQVVDPFGHIWAISTHKEDVPPAELEKRGREAMAQMAKGHGQ
jgi:uncharacterized glyoxalase superfamily protein PhnB